MTLDDLFESVSKVSKAGSPQKNLEQLADEFLRFTADNTNRWSTLFEHRLPTGSQLPEHYQKRVRRLIDLVKVVKLHVAGPDPENGLGSRGKRPCKHGKQICGREIPVQDIRPRCPEGLEEAPGEAHNIPAVNTEVTKDHEGLWRMLVAEKEKK